MKKFLVLSAIVGLAGIGIGLANRQDEPAATVVESAAEAPTSTTAAPAAPSTSPTTSTPKVTAKVPAKAASTTTTRPAASSSPTTATTAAPVTTTTAPPTTTTTTVAAVSPTCTVSADNPSVSQGGSQTIRVTSNMPTTKVKIEMAYPKFGTGKPNPRQTYTPTTDSSGSVVQTFNVNDWSTEPVAVQVQFYAPAGGFLGGPACRTSFMSAEG